MRRRVFWFLLFPSLLFTLAACGGSSRPPLMVNVSETSTTVPVNGTDFFSATVINSSNQTVTWAVMGGSANGTIDSSGTYHAPASIPANPQVTITATPAVDPAISGQANVTITLSMSVSPAAAFVQTLATKAFSATVQGSSNQAVTWQVNGVTGGNITVGTISSSGLFQAPESVPSNTSGQTTTVTVSAISQANPSLSASAVVTVTSPNQLGENTPVKLGSSGGNVDDENARECEGGTLGSLLVRAGTQFILSNNHVLARSDTATLGEGIIQPGLIDTPSPCVAGSGSTTVGNLSQFVTLEQPAGCVNNCAPPVDAAIAKVVSGTVDTSGSIIELGAGSTNGVPDDGAPASTILPVASITPGSTAVAKSGRSTGLTCSTVEAINVDTQVQYTRGLGGPTFTATYHNQISVNGGTFSAAGDSGSLIVSQAGGQPVALLYAGSDTNTVGNPAATVLANLGDTSNPQNFPAFVGPASRGAVAGCTSSGADAFGATVSQNSATKPSAAEISRADAVKNQNAPQLMSDPSVLAVGVDGSLDRPEHAAIVIFVQQGQPLTHTIPHTIQGVLTRVVAAPSTAKPGVLSSASTEELLKNSRAARANPTPQQLAAATAVKEKYSPSLMHQAGVLGVGVTASLDNPSEAAVIIYVEEGKPQPSIPLEFDGVRVRVKFTSPVRAYGWGHPRSRM